jgi:hypothetical protein
MLTAAYLHTKDPKYLTNVANTVNYHVDYHNTNGKNYSRFSQFNWMGSFFMEAVIDYYLISPNVKLETYIKETSAYASSMNNTRWVYTHGFAYHLTKQAAYLDRAVEAIKQMPTSYGNVYKDFASDNRALSKGTFYFADPQYIGIQGDNTDIENKRIIKAFPNPFTPEIHISIPQGAGLGTNPVLNIFSIDGRLVKSFRPEGKHSGQMTWHTQSASSGIYVINFNDGKRKYKKTICLVR